MKIYGLALSVVSTLGAPLALGATPPHQEFVCVLGSETRIIGLFNAAESGSRGGCRVEYTKAGKTQTLWSSSSNRAYCVSKATQLVTTVTQAKFHCMPRSIGQSQKDDGMTTPSEH